MIYVVSGFMRCGTSMMMRALEAGGMGACYSAGRDKSMNSKFGEPDKPSGYLPNERYYELDPADYRATDFPAPYEGKLIKCLWNGCTKLPPNHDYRVIFMRRPRIEIKMSLIAFFGHAHANVESPFFDAEMDRIVALLRDRRSMITVDEIWYGDVLTKPLGVFKNLDWPIDPEKAAAIPTRKEARFVA
jgi:hypothetical protein